jgi:hypothetical protein
LIRPKLSWARSLFVRGKTGRNKASSRLVNFTTADGRSALPAGLLAAGLTEALSSDTAEVLRVEYWKWRDATLGSTACIPTIGRETHANDCKEP